MVNALHYDERRDALTVRTDALDHGNLFAITRLDFLPLSGIISTGYDYYKCDLAYYKASLVEVINILVLDTVFRL